MSNGMIKAGVFAAALAFSTLGAAVPAFAASSSGASHGYSYCETSPEDPNFEVCVTVSGPSNGVFTPSGLIIDAENQRSTFTATNLSTGEVTFSRTGTLHFGAVEGAGGYLVYRSSSTTVYTSQFESCSIVAKYLESNGDVRFDSGAVVCIPV